MSFYCISNSGTKTTLEVQDDQKNESKALEIELKPSPIERPLEKYNDGAMGLEESMNLAHGIENQHVKCLMKESIQHTPMQSFLNTFEAMTTPQMRSIWEALLLNLNEKYEKEVVKSFSRKGNTIELTLLHRFKFFLLPCNSQGNETVLEGEFVLVLGDEKTRKLTFSTCPENKNLLNISGLSCLAPIPKRYSSISSLLGEYMECSFPIMEVKEENVIITAYKKTGLIEIRNPRSTPLAALIKHWREHGELLPFNQSAKDWLTEKSKQII